MDEFLNGIPMILMSILVSLVASTIFWLLTFKIKRVHITFSKFITKSLNTGEYIGKNRYRIKFINSGSNDLTEVQFIVRLAIKRKSTTYHTFLGIGNENKLPILRGKRYQFKHSNRRCAYTLTLYPINSTYSEFRKNVYSKIIQNKAKWNKLTLDEIFDEFKESAKITIYCYGNDAITGARRMFQSIAYSINEIKPGEYLHTKKPKRFTYLKHIADILSVED